MTESIDKVISYTDALFPDLEVRDYILKVASCNASIPTNIVKEPLNICQTCGEEMISVAKFCGFCIMKIDYEKEHEGDEKFEDPEIFDRKPLTLEVVKELNLTKDQISDLGLNFYIQEGYNPAEEDYVFCLLKFRGKEYYMIHGFPGDNSVGLIFNFDRREFYMIGELCPRLKPDNIHPLQKWYKQKTYGGSFYEDSYWYSSPREN